MAAVIRTRSTSCSSTSNEAENNPKLYYKIILEPPDSSSYSNDDSDESVFSVQAKMTDYVKDSSDISTEFSTEFEVASSPEELKHPWSYHEQNSSTCTSPEKPTVNLLPISSTLIENEDSTSCEVSSNDEETVLRTRFAFKFKSCIMCSKINLQSSFPYCRSCFKIKKEFFPEKPRGRKKRKRSPEKESVKTNDKKIKYEKDTSEESTKVDVLPSQPSTSNTEISTVDSGIDSQEWKLEDDMRSNDEECQTCNSKVIDAAFVHGKTAHIYCCYRCAVKIWFVTGKCPICRSKVSQVIRLLKA